MGRVKSDIRHDCPHADCTRTFGRKDHLQRHMRNHDESSAQLVCTYPGCDRSFVRHDLLTRHALRHEKGKGKDSTGDGVTLPSAVPAGTFINQQQQRLRMATVPSTSPYFQSSFTRSTLDIPVASTSTTPAYLAPELEFPLASTAGWSPPDDLGAGGDLSVFDLAGVSTLGSYEWLFNLSASTERVEEPLHAYANGHGTLAEEGFWAALAEEGLDAFQGPLDPGELLAATTSDGLQETIESLLHESHHPCTMHSSLKRFLSLYFAHFDTLNPLMHRPTFNPQATEPHLLLAMMAIGAFYGSDEECAVWQRLVPGLAGLVVVSEGFGPDASVQTILTTLLVEIHGKLMNTLNEHQMRSIFHPAFVNLALRNLIFEPRVTVPDDPNDVDSVWRAAVLDETAKRCAFASFTIDAEHALIFCHPPALSGFQLRILSPWDESEWTSPTAESWQGLRSHPSYVPPPSFASTLKVSLGPSGGQPHSSALGSSIVLYGLTSVMGDLRSKDKVMMGMEGFAVEGRWKQIIGKALESWKARLEAACLTRFGAKVLWKGLGIQVVAQIALTTEIIDIQIVAGWRRVLGKRVGKVAYEHGRSNLVGWVKSKNAAEAVWHAVAFLRAYLLHRVDAGVPAEDFFDIPHLAWCIYLCCCVCWSYGALHCIDLPTAEHFAQESPSPAVEDVIKWDDFMAEALAYVEAMTVRSPIELDALPTSTKTRTNGLIVFLIRETQNPRWEYGREVARRTRYLLRP